MCAVTVTCINCDVDAPIVGFGGYLGTPSLSTDLPMRLDEVDEELPFGYLYEPLQALLLRPQDLEGMYTFLAAHGSHQVVMWSDNQDEGDWPPELSVLLTRRQAERGRKTGPEGGIDDIVFNAGHLEAFWVFGHYGLHCACSRRFELDEPETLRVFEPQVLSRRAVNMMLSRWGRLAPDDGWNQALRPAVDPYERCMKRLLEFLRQHRRHCLEARVRPVGR